MSKAVSKRETLAYVVNSLHPGGTEKLVVEMSLEFSQQFNMIVVCLDEPGVWASQLRRQSIPVYCVWRQPGLDGAIPLRLAKLFRQDEVTLIHAHQCTAWFYCALTRLLYRKPKLLLHEHGRLYPEAESQKRILFNKMIACPLTHKFTAVSSDVRTRLSRFEGIKKEKIEVVYNGVHLEVHKNAKKRRELRQALGFRDDEFVIGTLGRLDPIKNIPLLIESIARLKKQSLNLRVLLIGDGPEFSAIEKLVKQYSLTDTVVMTGFRDDARTLLQCVDLFALVSFSEGTSMALLESMASELPAVVTDVGGNPEIVLKDTTGWVVASDNADELCDSITTAILNRDLCHKMAKAAKLRYQSTFTFSGMIGEYQTIYQDMLGLSADDPDDGVSQPIGHR